MITFFFRDHRPGRMQIYHNCRNHAKAQADLSLALYEKPNTVLMPGLDCFPNDPVWTNFVNFWLFFNRQLLCYFGPVLRYHLDRKLEKNLATLVLVSVAKKQTC